MKYHVTPVRMAIIKNLQTINTGEGVEKRKLSCTVGGNAIDTAITENIEIPLKKKKLEINLPHDLEILLLDIYPEKIIIEKQKCNSMIIAALLAIPGT